MIRGILGVIFGYLVLFVVTFITLTATYNILGQERTFLPGTYQLSFIWLVFHAIFALVSAAVAGKICRVVSGRAWPVYFFALSVLVLSFVLAIPTLLGAEGMVPRSGEVSSLQAMASGKAPHWFALLSPLLSAVGVVIGGKRKRK